MREESPYHDFAKLGNAARSRPKKAGTSNILRTIQHVLILHVMSISYGQKEATPLMLSIPCVGRIAKTPFQCAGFRQLPFVSEPIAKSSQSYAARTAQLPLLLPDEVC